MQDIIAQLLGTFAPLVLQIVADYRARHDGAAPTHEQIVAHFQQNAAVYLAEGAAWRASHPAKPRT